MTYSEVSLSPYADRFQVISQRELIFVLYFLIRASRMLGDRTNHGAKLLVTHILLISLLLLVMYKSWDSSVVHFTSKLVPDSTQHASDQRAYPKEAFVTCTDSHQSYVELLYVLLDSVHLFSSRPVMVFAVDFDLAINRTRHSRVIVQRISKKDCGPTIYSCKLFAMMLSQVNFGVQLDADAVVSHHIDQLFDMLHRWPFSLPLAPKHPDDPKNYRSFMNKHGVKYRSTPYMHGTFAWTHRAYPFIRHVFQLMHKGDFMGANYDETAMNVMLWEAKANHTLCKYDPYGPLYIDKYERIPRSPACLPYCDGAYLIFHGQKESSVSKNILMRLQKLGPNRPFLQTPQGARWPNDSSSTCCHPTATRPSSLHPLLCEYHKYDQA